MFVNVWKYLEKKYLEIFGNIGLEICYLGKIIKWKMSTLPISFHIEVDHQCRCAMCPVHWWPKVHHYSERVLLHLQANQWFSKVLSHLAIKGIWSVVQSAKNQSRSRDKQVKARCFNIFVAAIWPPTFASDQI